MFVLGFLKRRKGERREKREGRAYREEDDLVEVVAGDKIGLVRGSPS